MTPFKTTTTRRLTVLITLVAAAACSSRAKKPEPAPSMENSVTTISQQLVRVAELRTDLRSMRTCIHTFREESPAPETGVRRTAAVSGEARIGQALEQEFMLALANQIYVIDSESLGGEALADTETAADTCSHAGASHVLIGSYVLHGAELELSVRLVDTDSHVIIAATRGNVPVPALAESAAEAERAKVAATPTKSEVVSSAPPPTVATAAPETLPAPTTNMVPETNTAQAPTEVPAVTRGRGEDFETWRARKLQEPEPEEIPPPPVLPVRQPEPVEDFETWRQRKLEEEGAVVPVKPSSTPGELARETEQPQDSTFPWRNATLDKLLGIPPGTPVVGDPGGPQPVSSSYPWRTETLAELLRVKK